MTLSTTNSTTGGFALAGTYDYRANEPQPLRAPQSTTEPVALPDDIHRLLAGLESLGDIEFRAGRAAPDATPLHQLQQNLNAIGVGKRSLRDNLTRLAQRVLDKEMANLLQQDDKGLDPLALRHRLLKRLEGFDQDTENYVRSLIDSIDSYARSAIGYVSQQFLRYPRGQERGEIARAATEAFRDGVRQLLLGGVPAPIAPQLQWLEAAMAAAAPTTAPTTTLSSQEEAVMLAAFNTGAERFWMAKYGTEWNPDKSRWKFWEPIRIVFDDLPGLLRYAPVGAEHGNIGIYYRNPQGRQQRFELRSDRAAYRLDSGEWQPSSEAGPLSARARMNEITALHSTVVLTAGR